MQSPLANASDEALTEETWRRIRQGAAALLLWKPQLARALDSLFLDASTFANKQEKTLALARTNVERWFDATMDRTTGWYKRNVHLTLFIIGLFIAGFLNIDTFEIATTLWREPSIRQTLAAQAEKFELPPTEAGSEDPTDAIRRLSKTLSQDLNLPVGWSLESRPTETRGWLIKSIGLVVTAVATAQGAPFWFDVLDKFINVRGTGKKPTKKEKQGAEDQAENPK